MRSTTCLISERRRGDGSGEARAFRMLGGSASEAAAMPPAAAAPPSRRRRLKPPAPEGAAVSVIRVLSTRRPSDRLMVAAARQAGKRLALSSDRPLSGYLAADDRLPKS